MTRISRPAILLALACALVILLAPTPASACPSCYNHSQWSPNCAVGGCNYCTFCSYCCARYDIGCEYCYAASATAPGASADADCDDSAPTAADAFERLFGAAEPQLTAPVE